MALVFVWKVKYIGDILENVAKKNKYVGEKYGEKDMLKVGLMYYFLRIY